MCRRLCWQRVFILAAQSLLCAEHYLQLGARHPRTSPPRALCALLLRSHLLRHPPSTFELESRGQRLSRGRVHNRAQRGRFAPFPT